MVTGKPDEKKEPTRVPRSGHGAASLIPHLPGGAGLVQPTAGDAAPAQETDTPRPQGDTAERPPQAE
jgi:hypothetical protein